MNDDMKKAIEKACRVSALEVSLSGFVIPVETIFKDEYDHRIALLTRAMARLIEQRDNCHKGVFGDNYMAHDNIENENAEIIEILTGDET